MLTRLIVVSYAWMLETALWITLVLSSVVGYHITVPLMNDMGAVLTHEFTWKILGAILFPIIAFLGVTMIAGPLLVLLDVRQAVRNIEARSSRGEAPRTSLPTERREPHI
jgi:hypothetical protein